MTRGDCGSIGEGTVNHSIRLADGRCLGFAEYGSMMGSPVLFFHGAPGSRLSIFSEMAEAASERGLRLIAPDRPGYGLSAALSGRSVLDWTKDVLALTGALGIGDFKLIGFSLGSLYALICALALPEMVTRVAIVGGLAPLSISGVTAGMAPSARGLYDLARSDRSGLREVMKQLASSPATLVETLAASMSPPDQRLLTARSVNFEADFAESLRSGIEGVVSDFELASGEWPFYLEEIRSNVDLWVGSEDCNTPAAMTHYLASTIRQSQMHELPAAGHFCIYTHWAEVLDKLME